MAFDVDNLRHQVKLLMVEFKLKEELEATHKVRMPANLRHFIFYSAKDIAEEEWCKRRPLLDPPVDKFDLIRKHYGRAIVIAKRTWNLAKRTRRRS